MVRGEGLSEYLPIVDTALGSRVKKRGLSDLYHVQLCFTTTIKIVLLVPFFFACIHILHARYLLYDASALQNLYKRVHTSIHNAYGASSNALTIPYEAAAAAPPTARVETAPQAKPQAPVAAPVNQDLAIPNRIRTMPVASCVSVVVTAEFGWHSLLTNKDPSSRSEHRSME
jgi:hypothetical protein